MTKRFLKRNWQLILFNFIFFAVFILGYGRFGDVVVDSFREPYIAAQILKGQILYKNIFMIYPPLAYLINALWFLIFGINLKVIYFAGFFASLGFINVVFKIASKFMAKTYALSVILFIIAASALSPNVFNLIFPYSYGILYGILFISLSLYCALNKRFPASYFWYALALCSKYEFIFVLPALMWLSWKKDVIKSIIAFFLPLLSAALVLGLHGVKLSDLMLSIQFILSMSSSKTLYWFYSVSGLVFRPQLLPIYFLNFIKYAIPLIFLYYFRSYTVVALLIIYLYFVVDPEILIYAYPLIFGLFLLRFRSLGQKKSFFVIASLLISVKLFCALTLKSYGVYFLPFALIPLFILIPIRFKKALAIMLISSSVVLAIQNSAALFNKNVKIKTDNGVVYTSMYNGVGINALISYINLHVDKNEQVVIFPECLSVNFLTQRDSDNKFYSLIPLYVEVFGEDLIINRLKMFKPKYIVITNYDTSNYYYSYFGQDYAGNIFDYIMKNYTLDTRFGQGFLLNVFKLNE